VLPELGLGAPAVGLHYAASAVLWSTAYGVWLAGFLPLLLHPVKGAEGCN